MDLTQLANLGEFIGGVVVLVTWIYLAVQVRQGNRQTAASLSFQLFDMSSEIARSAQNREHAGLIVKMKHDEALDGVEEEQADACGGRVRGVTKVSGSQSPPPPPAS